jgi:hypothetical protein
MTTLAKRPFSIQDFPAKRPRRCVRQKLSAACSLTNLPNELVYVLAIQLDKVSDLVHLFITCRWFLNFLQVRSGLVPSLQTTERF